jgi:hypothetical protein
VLLWWNKVTRITGFAVAQAHGLPEEALEQIGIIGSTPDYLAGVLRDARYGDTAVARLEAGEDLFQAPLLVLSAGQPLRARAMTLHVAIRVSGYLSEDWADWFEGLAVSRQSGGVTLIEGHAARSSRPGRSAQPGLCHRAARSKPAVWGRQPAAG